MMLRHQTTRAATWMVRFAILLVALTVLHAVSLTFAPTTHAQHVDRHAVTIQQCDASDGVVIAPPSVSGGSFAIHALPESPDSLVAAYHVTATTSVFAQDGATTRALYQVFLN